MSTLHPKQSAGAAPLARPAAPWGMALGATLLMQTAAVLATQALPVLAPLVTRGANLPSEAIGGLYGLTMFGSVLFLAFGAPVLARFGPVRTLQLGAGLAMLGLLLASTGPLPGALLAAGAMVGLGNAPSVPAGSRILARTVPPAHRTLIFSAKQAGAPLGGMMAGLLLPSLALALGWPAAMTLVAGTLLAAALAVQPLRAALDVERDPARSVSPGALLAPANLSAPFAALRLHPLLMPLTVLCFGLAVVNGCLFALTASFLVEARGLALTQAGLAVAAMHAAGVTARLALGWLADRTGAATRNLLVQTFAAGAAVALLALVPVGAPPGAFVLAAAVAGFAASSWQGVALAEVARVTPPERVAEATAGASIVGFLGFAVGPTACTTAVSASGGWTGPLLAVAALLAVTAVVLLPWLRAGWTRP